MSRKSFLIWGLVIIQLDVTIIAVWAYLAISSVIDLEALTPHIHFIQFATLIISFGLILHLRFKAVGRRKRILAACLPFYIISIFSCGVVISAYLQIADFVTHGMMPIVNAVVEGETITTWIKMRYVLFLLPGFYLGNWGLFALLWFGSLDPRKPSKNGFISFMKQRFQRKAMPSTPTLNPHFNEVAT